MARSASATLARGLLLPALAALAALAARPASARPASARPSPARPASARPSSARADDASPRRALELELRYGRHGISTAIGHVVTGALGARVPIGDRLVAGASLPFVVAGVERGPRCCDRSPGNVTASLGGRLHARELPRAWRLAAFLEGSLSLPTAVTSGGGAQAALMAATAHLSEDAARFLPDTTALRLESSARLDGRRAWLRADGGLHRWIRGGGAPDATIGRIGLSAGLALGRRVSLVGGAAVAAALATDGEGPLGGSVALGLRRAGATTLGVRVVVPVVGYLRTVNLLGVAVELGRTF